MNSLNVFLLIDQMWDIYRIYNHVSGDVYISYSVALAKGLAESTVISHTSKTIVNVFNKSFTPGTYDEPLEEFVKRLTSVCIQYLHDKRMSSMINGIRYTRVK